MGDIGFIKDLTADELHKINTHGPQISQRSGMVAIFRDGTLLAIVNTANEAKKYLDLHFPTVARENAAEEYGMKFTFRRVDITISARAAGS